ncbi:hypothetical protein EDB83DRAFT_1020893 [Lactarius deliciosus]|nr:hypothetical protein EDB83DRAFT_1020893 [Lactarius deliciosus]
MGLDRIHRRPSYRTGINITTTSLFGLSLLNSAAIFATGLGLISKMAFFERNPEELTLVQRVDWNPSLKQEATRIAEKYLLARNERTQISQPYFKGSTICPPRRSRGLNHIMKRSRTDWIKQDVASLQELQSFFSVQKATTPSPSVSQGEPQTRLCVMRRSRLLLVRLSP